jgi:hypothetical protein
MKRQSVVRLLMCDEVPGAFADFVPAAELVQPLQIGGAVLCGNGGQNGEQGWCLISET